MKTLLLMCRWGWLLRLSGRLSDRSDSRSDWTCTRSLVSQCLFQSHSTRVCVQSQTATATAARRCTMPCHDLGRQVRTWTSRWVLVLLRHDRCFQGLSHSMPGKSPHLLQLADHESLIKWRTPLSVRLICSPVKGALPPESVTPSLIQIAGWHGCVLVHHPFFKIGNTWPVGLPKDTHKCSSAVVFDLEPRQAPRCVTNQAGYQDTVACQLFLQETATSHDRHR